MRRRVVKIVTLVSAIICVGSLLLVGRSFVRVDVVGGPLGQSSSGGITSIEGELVLWYDVYHQPFGYFSATPGELRHIQYLLWADIQGIRWLSVGWGVSGGERVLVLPLWLMPIVTAILPVRWWVRRRREGRRGFEPRMDTNLHE
jgi:hypothetical protein